MGIKEKQRYLVTSQHYGAANATIPVIAELLKRGKEEIPLASEQSEKKYEQEGFDYKTMEDYGFSKEPRTISKGGLIKILKVERPDMIIVGSSTETQFNGIEKSAILAAINLNVPVLSLLDFWGDYELRYKDVKAGNRVYPDKIAVPDKYAWDKMKQAGFPNAILAITGNPAYEMFVKNSKLKKRGRQIKRIDLGFGSEFGILYIGNAFEHERGRHGYWDLDNIKIINNALKNGPNLNTTITITLHERTPKESRDKIELFLKLVKDKRLKYINKDIPTKDYLSASDMILTPFSTEGINAALIGKPVFSMQPNCKEQRLITNELGVTFLIDSEEKFLPALKSIINNPNQIYSLCPGLKNFAPERGCVEKIIRECNNL